MFWQSRAKSKKLLKNSLRESRYLLEECYNIIDECLDIHSNKSSGDDFCHIFGLTLAKAKSYAHAMYSLSLDGLAWLFRSYSATHFGAYSATFQQRY